ncbi:hypothetical protein STEG23_005069, partial [Scotinomys teguina]
FRGKALSLLPFGVMLAVYLQSSHSRSVALGQQQHLGQGPYLNSHPGDSDSGAFQNTMLQDSPSVSIVAVHDLFMCWILRLILTLAVCKLLCTFSCEERLLIYV